MKETARLIIAGGRDFNDYELVKKEADIYITEINPTEIIIISGGAKGVDALGEKYAKENNLQVEIFKADWSKFGRAAGPKRNAEMAKNCTHLLSFWNGLSKGTKSMISLAKKQNKTVKVISIKETVSEEEVMKALRNIK